MKTSVRSVKIVQHIKIVKSLPPNIDVVRKTFTLSGKEIFAWGDTIYNPSGGQLTSALIAHEKVHFKQQEGNPEDWWDKYLSDANFRLNQELEAHRVEYRTFCRENRDRNKQARYLFEISSRLASPMYGNMLTTKEAMKLIRS